MPTASASPPSVITFMVSPIADSRASELSTASGIDTSTTRVARQEPRNSRIISPVRPAAMTPSSATSLIASDTNTDWSNSETMWMSLGAAAMMPGSIDFTVLTMSSVEVEPFFSTGSNRPFLPLTCTMFCCGGPPARAQPTSRSRIGEPFTSLIGMVLSASSTRGSVFSRMMNWVWPNFASPEGSVRLCALTALTTCCGVRE